MSSSSYQAQAYARVWQIQQMLHPKPSDLISASRFFIREGELAMWHQKKRKKSKRYFFLFNDIMLLTKRQSSKKYLLRIHITLRSPSVSVESIDSASFNWEFRLHCRTRSFILYANGEEDRELWTADMEKSIKGTHEEEKKTKEKHDTGETKIPTDQVASPRSDLSPRHQTSSSTPDNVKHGSNISTGPKKKAGKSSDSGRTRAASELPRAGSDDARARSVSELPKKSTNSGNARAASTQGLPAKKTRAQPAEIRSSPGIIQNEHVVTPVPFENSQTGIFVYPNPMTTNNPFLDVPAANQNPFATNTFTTGSNPYATNSPFAPNPNRMTMDPNMFRSGSPFATTPANFGQSSAFAAPSGGNSFGSASNPFSTNNPAPANPFATTPNPPASFGQPAPAPANPFMTNSSNPFATNNPNPFATTPAQPAAGHYF